jgi:hypothetical protein
MGVDEKTGSAKRSEEPLFGKVSVDGYIHTVCFARKTEGYNASDLSLSGYDCHVFDNLPDDLPIVRFDKSNITARTFQFCPFVNGDRQLVTKWDKDVRDTEAELAWFVSIGVPITTLAEYKAELSGRSDTVYVRANGRSL